MKTYIVAYLAGQLLMAIQAPGNMPLDQCKQNVGMVSQQLRFMLMVTYGANIDQVTFDCIQNTGRP